MIVHRCDNYEMVGKVGANIISAQLTLKPDSVIGLATGSSPVGIYQALIKKYQDGEVDFSRVSTINLDEYKDIDVASEASYRYFMDHQLFNHVNIDPKNTFLPNAKAGNADEECSRYDRIISDHGGIDLQVLGIGMNGHVGFNEPAEQFIKNTNCVALTESTINANKQYFAQDFSPTHAYTMGIGPIIHAKLALLVVSGESKAKILKEALLGPITPQVPASILQLHTNLHVVGDEAALAELCAD